MIKNSQLRTIEDIGRYMQSTPDLDADRKACDSCHYSSRDLNTGWFCHLHNKGTMWCNSCKDYLDARKL